ncbi:MAG: hypothetical protein NZ585_00025 [Chloracidobacterium sp.]|nr:hypothetical protein [Chloracidobacterium sp.]
MPPTVWCAQHAVRFPFNPAAVEQTCPAGHGLRLEGVTGYCPVCDLHWDARQAEHPDVCPYCQAPDATRRLCHVCERITYLPNGAANQPRCSGCGATFAGEAAPHACRVLRTTIVTQRRHCPACHETVTLLVTVGVVAPSTVPQSAAAQPPASAQETTAPTAAAQEDAAVDRAAVVSSDGIAITTPVRVRELHQQYLPKLIRVHFDYNLRRFFRNEKGLFYACGVGVPPQAYHIIPSWSRFGVAGDFIHWFSEIFDCDQPRGGDIWVHAPAVADAEGILQRKGKLEVNRPPDAPPAPTITPPASARDALLSDAASRSPVAPPVTPERPAAAPLEPTNQTPPAPASTAPPQPTEPTTDRRPWQWLPWFAAGVVAAGVGGFGVWKAYVASPPAGNTPQPAAPRPASRPNQPQTETQSSREAILTALDGLAQSFSAQQREHYRSYFDATLRPYYNRREGTAERAASDMAKLWETYAPLSMTHDAPQVQLDAGGKTATVTTNRTLTGRHRQTGAALNDTTRIAYRFVKRGRYWLVAGVQEIRPTTGAPSKSKAAR